MYSLKITFRTMRKIRILVKRSWAWKGPLTFGIAVAVSKTSLGVRASLVQSSVDARRTYEREEVRD